MKRTGSFAAFDDFLAGVEADEKRRLSSLSKIQENRRRLSDLSLNGNVLTRAESFRSNDSSNLGDSTREEEDETQDVRETLFSYIPHAFEDDVHFQRVIITESQELVDHDTRGVDTETVIVGEHRIIAKDRKLTEFDGKLADQLTPEQVAQAKVLATDAHKALGYKNASFTDVAEPSGTKNPGTQSADQKLDSRQTQNR